MKPKILTYHTPHKGYADDAQLLRLSAERFGYDVAVMTPVDRGSWVANVNIKPELVLKELKRSKCPVLFLDADCLLHAELPFFNNIPGDISLDIFRPSRLRNGFFCQAYKHKIWKEGCMWNSGIALFVPNHRTLAVVEKWVELSKRRPGVWDQINLINAWIKTGRKANVVPIPDEYIAGRALIGHRSGFHRYNKEPGQTAIRKVLVLGSAPYISGWWKKYGEGFIGDGWTVAAINNAWEVPGNDLDYWLHPVDFTKKGPPDNVPRNSRLATFVNQDYYAGSWNNYMNWLIKPSWLTNQQIQTMILVSLHHLFNEANADGCKIDVAVAGSDLVYPKDGPTHFYGEGTPDPLRFTEIQLRHELEMINYAYTNHGCRVYNAGGQGETLLPFERFPDLDQMARPTVSG